MLFRSERFGHFLYSALSNAFIELDEFHYRCVEELRRSSEFSKPDAEDEFLFLLRQKKILVEEGEEEQALMERHYRRNGLSFDNAHLVLSICPTLRCNFRCSYCFQDSQQSTTVMSADTVERLISFIRNFKHARSLSITWYGGEPTMAFGVIGLITRRIKELDILFEDAGLVTNGYLLGDDKIKQLNDLNIKTVQITLDGPEEVHDSRRVLVTGGPTHQRIMKNVDALMSSDYQGGCRIRINVDRRNLSGFFELRARLLDRFEGKNLCVYAGCIDTAGGRKPDRKCNFCAQEWVDFTIRQYREIGVAHRGEIYPAGSVLNICSANSRNGFVVGPDGELYKCWEDVGKADMVIGTIYKDDFITNRELVVRYSVGSDPYLDAKCRECKVLPICGGGCANKRLRAKYFHEEGLEFCSLYKDSIVTYLMEYYDVFLAKEMCRRVLAGGAVTRDERGYRLVHP